jgi:hypothetical protein
LVLDGQHAAHATAAQYRHAEEGMIDFLTGFRPVGEMRMVLRLIQRERARMGRHIADQALADAQASPVYGRFQEAFGGEQLQYVTGPQQVDRADLGDNVAGDDADHLVEARLRIAVARHHIAQAAKQQSRSDPVGCVSHSMFSAAENAAFERYSVFTAPALSPTRPPIGIVHCGRPGGGEGRCRPRE